MGISFRPAVRSGEKLMIGIAGPSGSGKTFSALEIATGLQKIDGGEICVIDTENRRAAMYADRFKFMHGELRAPFTPEAYLGAIEDAVKAGAKVVVIDSMSHEHEGEGGILEMHEENVNRMAGENASYGKREAVKFSAWIEPKRRHNKLVNRLLQVNAHIVFCFRAKEKLKMVKVEKPNGRTVNEPVSTGWQPIAADRLEYEMTTLLVLPPNAKGRPDLSAEATKLPEPIAPLIEDGWQISSGLGVALAEWARGGAAPKRDAGRGSTASSRQEDPPPREDGPGETKSPEQSPARGPALLREFNTLLAGAGEKDELAARHEGFDALNNADKATVDTARDLYRLHFRRVTGKLSPETCREHADQILEGEMA